MNKLSGNIDKLHASLQHLESQKLQLIGQARQSIEAVRMQCKDYLDGLQTRLNFQFAESEKNGTVRQYLQGISSLKNAEYQTVKAELFEIIYPLLLGGTTGPGENLLKQNENEMLILKRAADECMAGLNNLRIGITGSNGRPVQVDAFLLGMAQANKQYDQKNYKQAAMLLTTQLNALLDRQVMAPYSQYIDRHLDALRKTGDKQGVARLTQLIAAVEPERPVNHYNLGVAQANCGRLYSALEALRQGKLKGFTRPQIFLVAGDICEKLGDPIKALEEYEGALKADSNNATAREKKTKLLNNTSPKSLTTATLSKR